MEKISIKNIQEYLENLEKQTNSKKFYILDFKG